MATLTKRATIYMEPSIHKALKLKSIESEKSLSKLVNESLKFSLREDAIDISSFNERENESTLKFEDVVKNLKKDGKI